MIYIYIYIPLPALVSKRFLGRGAKVQQDFDLTTDATGVFNSTLSRDIALPVNATIEDLDNIPLSEVQGFKEPALPWYSDQALPFDVTMAAANEYGAAASCKLFGVEILNEGFGSSVDDSVLEMQATFVARSVPIRVLWLFLRKVRVPLFTRARARVGLNATIRNRCRSCYQKPHKSLSNDYLRFFQLGHMESRNGDAQACRSRMREASEAGMRSAGGLRGFFAGGKVVFQRPALPALAPRTGLALRFQGVCGRFEEHFFEPHLVYGRVLRVRMAFSLPPPAPEPLTLTS